MRHGALVDFSGQFRREGESQDAEVGGQEPIPEISFEDLRAEDGGSQGSCRRKHSTDKKVVCVCSQFERSSALVSNHRCHSVGGCDEGSGT